MQSDWPFDQAHNVAAITTRQVLDGAPILRVVHYEDDHSWAFTCGNSFHTADGRVISMKTALNIDPTLQTIADLPPGWNAWRESVGGEWQREISQFEDEES